MLHVEQPDASDRRDVHRRQVDEEDGNGAEPKHEGGDHGENRHVGHPHARGLAIANGDAFGAHPLQHDHVQRPEAEDGGGMTERAVAESTPWRASEILGHGERLDVAVTTAVQVSRRRMMARVLAAPLAERRQRHDAGADADEVVEAGPGKERSVRAVVHDDERAHEQSGGHRYEEQRHPVRQRERLVHRHEHGDQRQDRCQELRERASRVGALVAGDDGAPVGGLLRDGSAFVCWHR